MLNTAHENYIKPLKTTMKILTVTQNACSFNKTHLKISMTTIREVFRNHVLKG